MSNKLLSHYVLLSLFFLLLFIAIMLLLINGSASTSTLTPQTPTVSVYSENEGIQTVALNKTDQLQNMSHDAPACQTLVNDTNKKYPLDPNLFYSFKSLFIEQLTNDPSLSQGMLREASLQMISSTLSPAHVEIYKQGTARKKAISFDVQEEKRNGIHLYQLGILINAIQQADFAQAQVWLTNTVEANPNSLLLNAKYNKTLLAFVIEEYIQMHGFSEQSISGIVEVFKKAGYKIHFLELLAITQTFLVNSDYRANQNHIIKILFSEYEGSINHVFNYEILSSTNLLEVALYNGNFLIAKFWRDQGVEVATNLTDRSIIGSYPKYGEDDQQTQAVLSLLESGSLSFKADPINEKELNEFLPQKNAHEYYERFAKRTLLSSEQQQIIQRKIISFTKDILALQSKSLAVLPDKCSAQYLQYVNLTFSDINQEAFAPSELIMNVDEQELAIVLRIAKDRQMDKKEKFKRLSMIDGRLAKEELERMLIGMDVYGESPTSDKKYFGDLDLSTEDEILMEQVYDADMKGDYILIETLLGQMKSLSEANKLSLLLETALSNNVSPEKIVSILQAGAEPHAGNFVTLLADRNIETLQVLLNHGYSVNYNAEDGFPLLKLAAINNTKDGFLFLLEAGADIELPIVGFDALDIALKKTNEGHQNYFYIEQLLMRGKLIEESHRQVLRELLIKHPAKMQTLLDKYSVAL